MSLNWRQEQFCRYYVQIGILAEACRRAGYPDSANDYASKQGSRLMKNEAVKERIQELEAEAFDASELTKDRLLGQLIEVLKGARESKNWNAASATLERLLKASGNWVDRREDITRTPDTDLVSALEQGLGAVLGKERASEIAAEYKAKLNQKKEEPTALEIQTAQERIEAKLDS